MIRVNWLAMVRSSWRSLWCRLAVLRAAARQRRRAARFERRRREQFTLGPAAAELCETRQLLSAAITAVSPNSGAISGGTTVTIVGSGFDNVSGVQFGMMMASSYQVLSSTAISAVAPSQMSSGTVDISVETMMDGSSPFTTADQFDYTAGAPQVTGVSPNTGSSAGGNTISISGSGFTNASAVLFGTTAASSFMVMGDGSISATAPAHTAGNVDVIVVTSQGSSTANPADDQYSFTSSGPTVSSVSPGTGSGSGGTSITITGTGFNNVMGVSFGGTNASSFMVNSPSSITAVAPAHSAGMVDVVVSTSGGSSSTTSGDEFVYSAPVTIPAVTGLGTTAGTTAGGTQVVIMGTNLSAVSSVMFGGVAASSFTVNSATSITATTPAESAGVVDVKVANSAGTSPTSSADQYTFQSPAPVVAYLSTTTGTTAGGTPITISGSNFVNATGVYFGTAAAASFTVNSPNSITAYPPAHAAGAVDVTVRNSGGTSTTSSGDQYTFVNPRALPTISGLSVSTGPLAGGTTLVITGANFTNVTGISFGSVAASYYSVTSSTSIMAEAPAGSGTVDVTVTTQSGTSAISSADQYTYSGSSGSGGTSGSTPAPVVVGLSTSGGSTAGGTSVLILGSGMLEATGVLFGSVPAASYTIVSDGEITAVSPAVGQAASLSGPVDVTVQYAPSPNETASSALTAADHFTYTAPGSAPTLTGLDVTQGSTAGSTVVTISGTNFTDVTGVNFGSVAATLFLATSSNSVIAVSPAWSTLPASTIDITVTTAAGTTPISAADQFTYVAAATSGSAGSGGATQSSVPTITGLSVSSGAVAGGDNVTITGTNLTGVTSILFGSVPASSFVTNSDGTLLAVSPAESAGTVDVTIVTLNGTTAATAADRFTFAAPPPAPTVTGLSTAIGATTGGAAITIGGTNFTQVTGVDFGSQAAKSFTLNADGTITAVAPGEPAGTVDVSVTTRGGTSAAVGADQFTFSTSLPVVSGLDVSSGFSSGGDSITLFGANLLTATAVFFGGVAAHSFAINDDGSLTAVTPSWPTPPASPINVTVQNSIGTSATSADDLFTVTPAGALPTVVSLGTTVGPAGGGGMIMITGANFTNVSSVTFGGVASSSFHAVSTTTLVARVPAAQAAGLLAPVDVTVTTFAGTSAVSSTDRYTYTGATAAPVISSLSAASGYATGGETISIYGSNFTGTTAVLFGDTPAASFTIASDSLITVVTPVVQAASLSGPIDITLQNAVGASATGPQDQYTFTPAGALPTVIGLSPPSGSTYGGDTVIVTGTNFTDVSGVSFVNSSSGTQVAATSFTVISPTSISIVTPAVAIGTVDVKVTTPAGTSAVSTADQFAFTVSPPAVTSLSSASGFAAGGDAVTIEGTDLSQASAVYFGSTPATSFTINPDGSITAIAPSVADAASVGVTVVTPGGTSESSDATQFTFTPTGSPPTVTALSSSSGTTTGGQTITITGANFTDVTSVNFGTVAAASFTVVSPTTLEVTTPAVGQASSLSGPVDVTVTTPAGTSAPSTADLFQFQVPAPIVTGLSTKSGFSSGGETVVISGINLAGASAVLFGTTPAASFTCNANGTISAIVPAVAQAASLSGPLDVTVQTPSGTSAISVADQFTVTPAGAVPTVAALSVSSGTTAGGEIVTLTGVNFTDVSGVSFGGIAASKFVVDSPTRITAYAPAVGQAASLSQTVDVVVTTPAGSSPDSATDLFTFTAPPPQITGLSAASGFSSGGDTITIQGNNLAGATAVYFGSVPATSFTTNADGTISALVPAVAQAASLSAPVVVSISVQTPAGSTGPSAADQFTYTPAGASPTVSGLSVNSGATTGGQMVVITGSNFTDVSAVKFGSQPASLFYVMSPTSIAALSPSAAAGTSSVTVTSAAGTSASTADSTYTASAPASSGSDDSGTDTTGTDDSGSTTGSSSYVVTPFTNGGPEGAIQGALGTFVVPYSGLLTSYGGPTAPSDPYLNPVVTLTVSGDINDPSMSWTMTDGGTKVMFLPMTMIMPNNGGTQISFMSNTLTFSFSSAGYSSLNSAAGYANLSATDTSVEYTQYTASDGTGYTTIDLSTSTSTDTFSYNSTTNNVNSGTYNATGAVNSTATASYSSYQHGLSSLLSGGQAVAYDSGSSRSTSTDLGTVANGVTNVNDSTSESGSDSYTENDTLNSPIATGNDNLAGGDAWSNSNSLVYQQDADGSSTSSSTSGTTGSGYDLYSNQGTTTSSSNPANADGSAGDMLMIDMGTTSDVGSDLYTSTSSETVSGSSNGPVTTLESHDDTDNGLEDVQSSHNGVITTNEPGFGGGTVGFDTFNDSDDDRSDYADSDDETPLGNGGADDDELASSDDAAESFNSGDASVVADTSVAVGGVVTSDSVVGSDSDAGTDSSHDDIEDDETLSAAGADLSDDLTFDDSAQEQDTARTDATIEISAAGLVAAGDLINSTETITLGDVTTTTQGIDDPGSEDDTPASDDEADDLTESSDVTDKLHLTDNLHSVETTTAADGTVTTNDDDSGFVDDSHDDEDDSLDDEHADGAGGADPVSDDETFDDVETDSDSINGSDEVGVSTEGPITIPSTTLGQPTGTGTQSTSNVVGDKYTESDSETNDDSGEEISQTPEAGSGGGTVVSASDSDDEHDTDTDTFEESDGGITFGMSNSSQTLTDPATGVMSTTDTSAFDEDKFSDNETDNDVDKHTSADDVPDTDDITDSDFAQSDDSTLDYEEADVSTIGSPSAGTTESISSDGTMSGLEDDSESDSDQAQAAVSGSAETDEETNVETDDTVGNETIGTADNSTTTTIDPATGLQTVVALTDGGTIDVGDDEFDLGTDVYTIGQPDQAAGGEDDITGLQQNQNTIDGKESSTDTTSVTGAFPDGSAISSTDVRGEVSTISLDAGDNEQTTGVDLETPTGQDTSETLQTAGNSYDSIQAHDQTSEAVQSTASTIDPVTGLKLTLSTNNQTGDTSADTDGSNDAFVSTYASGPITPGIVPTGTGSGSESGDDDETQTDSGFEHDRLTVTAQGTDAQGEQVNLTDTTTLDDSATDEGSDDDTVAADETDTEVTQDHVSASAQATDFVTGSVASVNAATGVTTTTTYDDLNVANGSDIEDDDATTVTPSGGNGTGSGSSSESSPVTAYWNIQETTTQTHADGSAAGASSANNSAGNDTQSDVDGVTTDLGATGIPPASGNGTPPAISGIATAGAATAGTGTSAGNTAGGDAVVITGSGFTSDSQVSFGGLAAQSAIVVSPTTIVAVTPAHAAGSASVTVSNGNGTSGSTPQGEFDFQAPGNNNNGNTGTNPITITPPGQVINPAGGPSSLGGFTWLTGQEKGARSRLIDSLAQDGFKAAYDPGAAKLNTVIQQVQTNQANAAQLLGSDAFLVDQTAIVAGTISNGLRYGLLGKWSGVEPNGLGIEIGIGLGLVGADLPKDIADLSYDIANWKWTWGHAGETALDLVGTIPVIGVVKNIRNASKAATAAKATANLGDAAANAVQVGNAVDAAQGLKQAANGGSDLLPILNNINCFAPDTLVATPNGPRRIADIAEGDLVLAYNFQAGEWNARRVTARHENVYEGPVLTVWTTGGEIRTTVHHPFWVLRGSDLTERAVPRKLSPNEDQGQTLTGRWVNSHELRVGDTLIGRGGRPQAILRISQEFHSAFPVNNITVDGDHTFAVGNDAVLVHNTSECDLALGAGKGKGGRDVALSGRPAEEAVSEVTSIPLNRGPGRDAIPGTGPGGVRYPDLRVFGDAGSIALRGSIIEVKDVARLEARGQLRDLIQYAKDNNLIVEIFTNAPEPLRGKIAEAIEGGFVKLLPIP